MVDHKKPNRKSNSPTTTTIDMQLAEKDGGANEIKNILKQSNGLAGIILCVIIVSIAASRDAVFSSQLPSH